MNNMVELKNDVLTIKVAEMGAELQSVKDNSGREYMWQAGEKWPRHSPILFPIVCHDMVLHVTRCLLLYARHQRR